MLQALNTYGHLTEKQAAAVSRLTASEAQRERTREAERVQRETAAPVVTVAKVEQALASASQHLKRPKLRLGNFTFSLAPSTGKNAGAIYVKAGEAYLGKVTGGKFHRSFQCTPADEAAIVTAAADPEAAAVAYGQRFGQCACCGRELTNHESIERGIGPICASRFGW